VKIKENVGLIRLCGTWNLKRANWLLCLQISYPKELKFKDVVYDWLCIKSWFWVN